MPTQVIKAALCELLLECRTSNDSAQNVLSNGPATETNDSDTRQTTPGWEMFQPKEADAPFTPKHGNVDPIGNFQNPKFDFNETL